MQEADLACFPRQCWKDLELEIRLAIATWQWLEGILRLQRDGDSAIHAFLAFVLVAVGEDLVPQSHLCK